jgi:hypothetical protein
MAIAQKVQHIKLEVSWEEAVAVYGAIERMLELPPSPLSEQRNVVLRSVLVALQQLGVATRRELWSATETST